MIKQYQRKSDITEAVKLTQGNIDSVALWCGGQIVEEINPADHSDIYYGLNVPTLSGVVRASKGDYVVKGANGTFRRVDAGEFESKYEEAGY